MGRYLGYNRLDSLRPTVEDEGKEEAQDGRLEVPPPPRERPDWGWGRAAKEVRARQEAWVLQQKGGVGSPGPGVDLLGTEQSREQRRVHQR